MDHIRDQLIRFNGKQLRETNSPISRVSSRDSLRDVELEDSLPLDELLRKHRINGEYGRFWTAKRLHRILTKDRVLAELSSCLSYSDSSRQQIADLICADVTNPSCEIYLKVFAILLLIGKAGEIGRFIDAKLCDAKLPVVYLDREKNSSLCLETAPKEPLQLFARWMSCDTEMFEITQWQVLVPFFETNVDKTLMPYDLSPNTILPWCKPSNHDRISPSLSGRLGEGAFAEVSLVRIHPTAHAFHETLRKIKLEGRGFAVKKLFTRDRNEFRKERDQLMRFSGLVHDHLVTLLCAFTFKDHYHFIFPLAKCNLEEYWADTELPWSCETARWASNQLMGIMGAVDTIHNPRNLAPDPEKRFGRHGDIKSDNILCFTSKSPSQDMILVISDLGSSSFNRYISRSNIPNNKVPPVPGYLPPELELEDGRVSRAFDIWTAGCLYLEFVTWLLGGRKLRERFEDQRTTEYITGSKNDIFFVLKKREGEGSYVAQVKPEVTKWINSLRENPRCSQLVLDVLKVVEQEMLVVISADHKRSPSGRLRARFQDIHLKSQDESYCLRKTSYPRVSEVAMAVEASLSPEARNMIQKNKPNLEVHSGETRKPMSQKEWENMV
ncbi:hypothetical protein AK830_g9518 [Neonectria ditissima]|uniref:Protein kinase domain-containing protein n=1 Tax=Neonectria ditissima TaxID=78410 RepID=A0A0P7AUJ9_9HYPO|nr:hypothetical protein AK830_g9518 [Neonectria ditissima]